MSKNERVNTFSLLLFFLSRRRDFSRIQEKACFTTRQSLWVCLLILQSNNIVSSKEFHHHLLRFVSLFFDLLLMQRVIEKYFKDSNW